MRPIERVLVFGGVCAAIVISLAGRAGEGRAYASGVPMAAEIRIATIDPYVVSEAMMDDPGLKKIRTDATTAWQARVDAIKRDLEEFDRDLSILPQNDPKVQDTLKKVELKRQDYQKTMSERQADLERINSTQLIDSYKKVRATVEQIAKRQGITHVFSNREYTREITTSTISLTLQELLARPIVNAGQVEDLTKQVMDEMKLKPAANPGG